MLLLEYVDDKGNPVRVRAGRILVRCGLTNTPIMFGTAIASGHNLMSHALDADFLTVLQHYRVNDTFVVTELGRAELPPPKILLPG